MLLWSAVLQVYSGYIQSIFLILLITEISGVHNGVEYTHVSVINNMYLGEMDLVLATMW